MTQVKAYVKDGIYIPIKYVKDEHEELLPRRFEKRIYVKESVCEKCDYYSERHCDVCDDCPNFGGHIKLHRKVEKGGKTYLRLPFGDIAGVRKIFGEDTKIIYKLPEIPMKRRIKFVQPLHDYQKPACQAMEGNYGGILKSAPRTGKTVMSAKTICDLGLKTIILAAQRDWLENFYETFVGSDTQAAMTDAKPKRIGFARKFEEFEKYDIALATYQTFLSPKGKKLLKKIKKMFSVMVIDEVQTVPSTEFSIIVSQFECLYKHGLSGTPERKDTKEWTAYKLLGPVFYETKVDSLKPSLDYVQTEFNGPIPKTWPYMVRKLENDPGRLKLIAKTAIKDVKAGHLVLIPLTQVIPIRALVKAINQMYGKNIAAEFTGRVNKEDRKSLINKARNYKKKIIVGTMKLLSTGINIPRASMLYEVTPSSNPPKAEQRFRRVCTPLEGKPQPVIKYFLDDFDIRRSCMRNEYWQVMVPKMRPRVNPRVQEVLTTYMSKKKYNPNTGTSSFTGGRI